MNLPAYDNITQLNKQLTWIDIKYKEIFSKEIHWNKYAEYKKKYNPRLQETEYYLVLETEKDNNNFKVRIDDYGRTRIKVIKEIWEYFNFNSRTTNFNINLEYVEETNDYIIYKIII